MSKKLSILSLIDNVATAAVAWQKADLRRASLRRELNAMYATYFRAHGHPYPGTTKRIDPQDESFEGVLRFTAAAYGRFKAVQAEATKLKRKMRSAILALERAQ